LELLIQQYATAGNLTRTDNHGFDSRRLEHSGSYLKMTFSLHYGASLIGFGTARVTNACPF
jgi:hypothetical protein